MFEDAHSKTGWDDRGSHHRLSSRHPGSTAGVERGNARSTRRRSLTAGSRQKEARGFKVRWLDEPKGLHRVRFRTGQNLRSQISSVDTGLDPVWASRLAEDPLLPPSFLLPLLASAERSP